MVDQRSEDFLVLIPARSGSKGVVKKNVKPFADGASLIERTIGIAKSCFEDKQIVVSSDDDDALKQAEIKNVIAHRRNPELASDTSGMLEVMLDAISTHGQNAKYLMLLQVTSPFRTEKHVIDALTLLDETVQAVIAVNKPKGHPYYTLFEQKGEYIQKFQSNDIVRRQDLPDMFDVNGLMYIFHIPSLKEKSWVEFDRIKGLEISALEAMDIDTEEDWTLAELIEKNKSKLFI
jgi:N-acylneuraminate cytidylyltransferase